MFLEGFALQTSLPGVYQQYLHGSTRLLFVHRFDLARPGQIKTMYIESRSTRAITAG